LPSTPGADRNVTGSWRLAWRSGETIWCGFDHGSLQIYERELFRAVAVRGLPEPLADRLREGFRPNPQNPMAGLLRGDRFVHMPDLTLVEEARFAVEYGSRTVLCVPLRKDGVL